MNKEITQMKKKIKRKMSEKEKGAVQCERCGECQECSLVQALSDRQLLAPSTQLLATIPVLVVAFLF